MFQTVPPTSVEIIDQHLDSKIEVQENHKVTIECKAWNSRPASKITWFRGNTEINPGESILRNIYYIFLKIIIKYNHIQYHNVAADKKIIYILTNAISNSNPEKSNYVHY